MTSKYQNSFYKTTRTSVEREKKFLHVLRNKQDITLNELMKTQSTIDYLESVNF
jgi:hypothetical protein